MRRQAHVALVHTQVLSPRLAVEASPAEQERIDGDTSSSHRPGLDNTRRLVAHDHRWNPPGIVAVIAMHVRPTYAAAVDAYDRFADTWHRIWVIAILERFLAQIDERFHNGPR